MTRPISWNGLAGLAVVVLAVVLAIAQWIAADLGRRDQLLTFDEVFYTHLGMQVLTGQEYSTRAIYAERLKAGHKLPDLTNAPLFIHPPLFPILVASSHSWSGNTPVSTRADRYHAGVRVSVLMGSALLVLVFGLGRRMLGTAVALVATVILVSDLNRWIAAERVWIDMTLTFFAWVAVACFWKGRQSVAWMYATGLSLGLAMLCKYPGALVAAAGLSYLLIFERHTFRNPHLYGAAVLALLIMSPWFATVAGVHGTSWWKQTLFGHGIATGRMAAFLAAAGLTLLVTMTLRRVREPKPQSVATVGIDFHARRPAAAGLLAGLCLLFLLQDDVAEAVATSLDWHGLPRGGWTIGFFQAEPWYFYLRQHIAYSPLYLLTLITTCRLPWATRAEALLALVVFWVLLFGVIVGNFQSRYVLMIVPALALLNARTVVLGARWLAQSSSVFARFALGATVLLLFYGLAKGLRVVYLVGIVDNVAYY